VCNIVIHHPHAQVPHHTRLLCFAALLPASVQATAGDAAALLPRFAVTFVAEQIKVGTTKTSARPCRCKLSMSMAWKTPILNRHATAADVIQLLHTMSMAQRYALLISKLADFAEASVLPG